MVITNQYNLIMFNRCILMPAKHLRDLLAENVSIVKVCKNHTREIFERMFSEKVQELYAGIFPKGIKILPTTSENGALALSEAFMQGNYRRNII